MASVFCRKLRFFFFIFSVLSIAVFSVQDAQSQRFLPVENSPASLCSISMGRKGGDYTYYIGKLPPSKPVGFARSLWEGAFGMAGKLVIEPESLYFSLACRDAPLGQRQGGVFRLPPPYLWTPPTPQRAKGCSPLTILKKKSKHKKASAAPVGAIALTLFSLLH